MMLFQAANILAVAPRTVRKWIDAGRMPGSFRELSTGDYYISPWGLIAFMKEGGIPIPPDLAELAGEPLAKE